VSRIDGSFKSWNISNLILDIISRRTSGQLFLLNQGKEATIYFGIGRILAAVYQPLMGVTAIQAVLNWESGQFKFSTEMVLLSNLPRESWVRESLEEILGKLPHGQSALEAESPIVKTSFTSSGAQSSQFEPVSVEFINQLELLLKQQVGPFGGVLLEDAAEEIGISIEGLANSNLQILLLELKKLIPVERRQTFEESLEKLLKNF
jgi:Domain of unknown function (DUF4388)